MRPVALALLTVAITACPAPPARAAADEILWIPADGSKGWQASIARETQPAGVVSKSLMAPTWFTRLPDAKLQLAPSGTFDLASTLGKVLVIDFWASWCSPCQVELPQLQELYEKRVSKGMTALAINVDEDAATATTSARQLGLTMPVALNDLALYRTLGSRTLPTLFVVDRQGRLRARWVGYRDGFDKEIAAKVDALLAGDTSDTTRPVASVLAGAGKLNALWYRDLPGVAEGVVGLPAGGPDKARVVTFAAGMLLSFRADGETAGQRKAGTCAGRLLDLGVAPGGSPTLAGFRVGGTAIGIADLASEDDRAIAVPAPIVDLAVDTHGSAEQRRLVIATMGGGMQAMASDAEAKPIDGMGSLRAVASMPGGGVLALRADGTIVPLEGSSAAWPEKAEGAQRLLAARTEGAAVGSRTAVASAYGRFLPGKGAQLAVGTYAGHLVLLDAADGRLLFDAVWSDIHDLSAVDLDGDGLDELLVAAGHAVAALGAKAPAAR